jgi:hypothetical protein
MCSPEISAEADEWWLVPIQMVGRFVNVQAVTFRN